MAREGVVRGHHIGYQTLVSRNVFPSHNDSLTNGRVLHQHCLDLPQFNPVAAELDLGVTASEEFEAAIGPVAGEISRFVEARTRDIAEGMRNKPLGSQLWAVEVACARPTPPM